MNLGELIIPSIFALAGAFVAGLFARRLEKAKSVGLESEQLLKWAQEFRDAHAKAEEDLARMKAANDAEIAKTRAELLEANKRIDALERQVRTAADCNVDLQRELDQVKSEKSELQDRVTILEAENTQLKKQLDDLRKSRGRKGAPQ